MTTELDSHHAEPEEGSDRGFGLTVGGIIAAIGVFLWYRGADVGVWLAGMGLALVAAGIVAPRILHPLNVAWARLGILLGRIVAPIVMLLVYAISIVPIGLLLRAFGKDLLRLRRSEAPSYWILRDPPGPAPESLKDQF